MGIEQTLSLKKLHQGITYNHSRGTIVITCPLCGVKTLVVASNELYNSLFVKSVKEVFPQADWMLEEAFKDGICRECHMEMIIELNPTQEIHP